MPKLRIAAPQVRALSCGKVADLPGTKPGVLHHSSGVCAAAPDSSGCLPGATSARRPAREWHPARPQPPQGPFQRYAGGCPKPSAVQHGTAATQARIADAAEMHMLCTARAAERAPAAGWRGAHVSCHCGSILWLAPWQKHKRFEIGLGCLDHSVRDACEPPPQTRRQHGAAAMRSGGTPLVLELVQGVRSKAQAGGAEFVSRSGAGHVHWGSVLDFRALHLHALSRITGLGF
jgi:hypothetical protein